MRYVLSEDQKNELRKKYLQNVERVNQYLPDGKKVRTNINDLNRKLNDPKKQRMYIKGMELAQNRMKRVKVSNELLAKYSYLKTPGHDYLMDRTLCYLIDLRPGAENYNEALVKTYFMHPEAIAQYAYQKAMELNPGDILKIAKSDDMENLAIDFYEKNRMACDFAYGINDGITRSTVLNPDAAEYLENIKYDYQFIYNTGGFANTTSEDFFVIPELTEEQRELLIDTDLADDTAFMHRLNNDFNVEVNDMKNLLKNFAKNCEKAKLDIDKPGGFSYYATQKKDGEYIALTHKLCEQIKDEADIIKLDDDTSGNIRKFYDKDYIAEENVKLPKPMANDIMSEYMREFRYRYALNNNKMLHTLEEKSLTDMISGIRRGFFEMLRNSTSQYTLRLKEIIREFENPRSENYQNKEKLREAAQAYLDHRNVHNREEALRQSSAAKNRSILCLDIIAAVDATKDNIKNEFYKNSEIEEKKDINKSLEIDDNNLDLINEFEKKKDDDLFVDPEVILNEFKARENKNKKENNIEEKKEEFSDKIKDNLDEEKKIEVDNDYKIEEIEINTDLNKS